MMIHFKLDRFDMDYVVLLLSFCHIIDIKVIFYFMYVKQYLILEAINI